MLSSVAFREHSQVDVSILITREFDLEFPWDVFKAEFGKDGTLPLEHLCHQFRHTGAGPNIAPLDKKGTGLKALAEEKVKQK